MKRPKYILQFMYFFKTTYACKDLREVHKVLSDFRPKRYKLWEIQKLKRVTVDRREGWAR